MTKTFLDYCFIFSRLFNIFSEKGCANCGKPIRQAVLQQRHLGGSGRDSLPNFALLLHDACGCNVTEI